MAKTINDLHRKLRKLSKRLDADYEVGFYPAGRGSMSREDAENYIIEKNANLGRDPFFLFENEQVELLKLMSSAYLKMLYGVESSPQKALSAAGKKTLEYFRKHIDNNQSLYTNPRPYHPKYAEYKKKYGAYDSFLKLTGDFYKSLRYTIRRKD